MAATLIITAIVVLIFFVYYKISHAHSYWTKRGVVGPKPHPFYGNFRTVFGTREDCFHSITDRFYHEYSKEKVIGVYIALKRTLIIRDPDLVKTVLIRDFSSFVNRGLRVGNDPITRNLFDSDGDEWKTLRQKLTPIFTTGKLKNMMPLLNTCVEQYMDYLNTAIKEDGLRDVRKLKMKYTMKTITSIAFGLEVNTFVDETTEFETMAAKIFSPNTFRKFIFTINFIWPELLEVLHLSATDSSVTKFFLKLVGEVVKDREGKPKVRKDFMDLMVEMKEQGIVKRVKEDGVVELEMTHELITAQAIIFYAAGFETSSGAMSFLLYELAKQPDIQAKCQEEIDKVMQKYNGKLDYDALKELEYVSMAFDEALRLYPLTGVLMRQSVSGYKFKDINISIDKGTNVIIPVYSLHMDPKYFPDPEKFDPERFSPKNKDKHQDYYMPFGDGPRNCIGLRFALVQSMLCLAHFLHKYRVTPSAKTPKKITFDPYQATLASIDGIWLNVEKRKGVKSY